MRRFIEKDDPIDQIQELQTSAHDHNNQPQSSHKRMAGDTIDDEGKHHANSYEKLRNAKSSDCIAHDFILDHGA